MNGNRVIEIPLDDILPNRFQPRIKFHEKNINELADSIREHGVIQPIVVRKISDKYEIIAGERRYKASMLANKSTIPALIVNLNDQDAAEVALIENVQRQDLTPIEEAVSYRKILDMGMTQEQLASKLGKTQSTVANKLRLLNLDEEVQEALLEQKISERHARSLLKLPTNQDQVTILNRIISERLTVRKTDQVIKEYMEQPKEDTPEEIEVLDFEILDENKKENQEHMNENMNFNIPNTPIEGDQVGQAPVMNQPTQSIPEVQIPEVNTNLNPGFMDVNKIENQAQDIFTETPPADVENLLHQDAAMASEKVEEPEPQGKFFNIFPGQNQTEGFVSDIEKVETNMDFMPQEETTPATPQYNFDSFFNNNIVEEPKPIAEVEPKPVTEPAPVSEPQSTISQSFGINPELIASTPVPPVQPVENTVPTMESVSMPTFENSVNLEQNVQSTQNNFDTMNVFPTFEEPTLEPIEAAPVVEPTPVVEMPTVEVQSNVGFDFNVSEPTPMQTPVMETPQDLGFNMDFRNVTPNIMNENVEPMPAMNPEPIQPTPVVEQPVQPTIPTFGETSVETMNTFQNVQDTQNMIQPEPMVTETSNLKSVLDLIRNCATQVEALGYHMDIEEYDLENMYQVIFKINK